MRKYPVFTIFAVFLSLAVISSAAHAGMTVVTKPPAQSDEEKKCQNSCSAEALKKYKIPGLSQDAPHPDGSTSNRVTLQIEEMVKEVRMCTARCLSDNAKNKNK